MVELRILEGESKEAIDRNAYAWNTAGGLLNAFQSVIMLMVLTRVTDMTTAGIFTLAYANANLFLNMGKYGIRNFQASDVEPRYSYRAYIASRIITTTAMIVCSLAFLAYSTLTIGYSVEKIVAVALMTVFKAVEAFEDVYEGNYQQHGRLDLAAKMVTLRTIGAILLFVVLAIVMRELLMPLAVATAFSIVFMVYCLIKIKARYGLPIPDADAASSSAAKLLKVCLPLFLSTFLLFYIGNAPKYAIDGLMDDVAQAQYGFIAMPVFVVGLFAQFVYMPQIEPLSELWANNDRDGFAKEFAKQAFIVVGITAVCVIGAALLGVPVLGALYATDLSSFHIELCVLVAGGGFLALATLFTLGITIVRAQKTLPWGYAAVALIALLVSGPAVAAWGITGASIVYIACMAALTVWFGLVFLVQLRKQ